MNDRIKKLAEQAGHRYIPSSNSGSLRVEYLTPEIEKFAELIVRQCMALCEDVTERNDPAIACYYEIKQHFGVEE